MALSFARNKPSDKSIINKSKNAVSRKMVRSGASVAAQIESIVSIAESKLKHHKDDYVLIQDEDSLREYLDLCKSNGFAALDTETTGLNPLIVDLVGICIYTVGEKGAYIPIGHKSHITGSLFKNQLSLDNVSTIFGEYHKDINWIFHNAKYDIRVCRHSMNIDFKPYWDTMLAAYCIDENESHALKDLHLKYCKSKDTESLKFDKLFNGLTFDKVPISVAYLYAAGDAVKTFELYEYQKTILNRKNGGPYNVFKKIEMPLISVVADMEDRGVCLDFDVFGVDYNDYFPWIVKNKIMEVYDKISEKYDYIYVLANSIGAYFTMHTLQNFKIEKVLFISPILDMEQLIVDMMSWANVSEKELSERKEIPTDFGETLSWEYLCFVRANPINWKMPTEILYAEHDNLTSRQTVDKFIDKHCANLTVMNDGEHWFHTDEQIFFRDNWLRKVIQ